MRFTALATDYDGTLANDGIVALETIESLRRLRQTGRRVILVTGRTLSSLAQVFPVLTEFDAIVAENGGTLFNPATKSERAIADPPSEAFVRLLQSRVHFPLETGRSILATVESEKQTVLDTIQELGLELHIIFNKGSLMILPSGVNKATGLATAIKELGLSMRNVVGIGDAENDHAFLAACEFSAAVANALPALKASVQLVTEHDNGSGVRELIEELVGSDLSRRERRLGQSVAIGRGGQQEEVSVPACGFSMLIGSSGGGKSMLTTTFLEGLCSLGYQFCAIDAEGDYELFPHAAILGGAQHAPEVAELIQAVKQPTHNVVVNLLAVPLDRRPKVFQDLLVALDEFRANTGRPHCLIVDEAHYYLQSGRSEVESQLNAVADDAASGLMLITVNADLFPPALLRKVFFLTCAGDEAVRSLRTFALEQVCRRRKQRAFRSDRVR